MQDWIDIRKDPAHVARERGKARALRQSDWWRQQVQRGTCHYCGRSVPPDQLTMDHVVPVARGGRSTKGNVVPACPACNQSKKALTPAEQILAELERADGSQSCEEDRG
jgi:5-methylcytosine-specific restriction endonuclease McrA